MISLETPNFNERKTNVVDMIVLHYTGTESLNDAITRLCRKKYEVSAHYLVAKNGDIYQMVAEEYRAWHAGVSYWRGETDINSRSIGIEIENKGHDYGYEDYPDIQIASVVGLCKNLIEKYGIKPLNIVGHSDIAPSRKKDPGEKFPWRLLAMNGIGVYPSADELIAVSDGFDWAKTLNAIGYDISDIDNAVVAFKRHYVQTDISAEPSAFTQKTIYAVSRFMETTAVVSAT